MGLLVGRCDLIVFRPGQLVVMVMEDTSIPQTLLDGLSWGNRGNQMFSLLSDGFFGQLVVCTWRTILDVGLHLDETSGGFILGGRQTNHLNS